MRFSLILAKHDSFFTLLGLLNSPGHFSQGFSEDFFRRGYRGDYQLWVVLDDGAEEGFLFEGGAEEGGCIMGA